MDKLAKHISLLESNNPWVGFKEVMTTSGPIILGSLSYTVMGFVDTAMVARLGSDELAAVGSSNLWSYIMGCFLFGMIGCVGTFVAQSYGREKYTDCSRYAWQGIYLSLLAGLLALALLPLSGPLFRSMGHSENVTNLELLNFRIRLAGYVAIAWITALASFFQCIGRPGVPMYIAIIANFVNIFINYLLIFGNWGFPRLGIAGAAIATVIAMFVQVVLLQIIFLSGRVHAHYGSRRTFRPDWTRLYEVIKIGLPGGLMLFMDIANWGIFTSYIVGYFGANALASHNVAMAFMHVGFMPALGLNQGISVLVGQYIGRKDFTLARARTYTAIQVAAIYMFILGIIFATFGPTLIRLFFTDVPEVVNLGHTLLILAAIFQAFDAINIVTSGALRGAGDTRWMAIATFFFAYLFFLPLSLALAFAAGRGAVGAWIGATAYIIGLSGVLFTRFYRGRWQHIQIFASDQQIAAHHQNVDH